MEGGGGGGGGGRGGGGGGGGGGAAIQRKVRSATDVEKILEMHGHSKKGCEVYVVAVRGIKQSASMQRLLLNQIRDNSWEVRGMDHVAGVVEVHRLMSRSAVSLDRVIREVLAIQEPLTHGDVEEPALGGGSSEDEFDYELISRPDGEGQPLGCDSDSDSDHEVVPSRPSLPISIQDQEPPLGEGQGRPAVPFKGDKPSPLRRCKSETSLCLTDRQRHDAPRPRFDGPLSPAPAPLPGDETYPILARDVEEDGEFRGQILLLDYPDARPVGPYAARTISMSHQMLEAGTGTGQQPLLRAPELVGLAAMAVAGQSPPRHLQQHPALRSLLLDLVQSGQAMRRHPIGSPEVRSLVAEMGGRLELVGTDLLTERLTLHDSLEMLRLVKKDLHLLWDMRVPAEELKLM